MLLFDWAVFFDSRFGSAGTAFDITNSHSLRQRNVLCIVLYLLFTPP
jgi:hypothetical protein